MNALLVAAGIAVPVFASTNIDDIFVLLAFFSDAALKGRSILMGLGVYILIDAHTLALLRR